MENTTVDVVYSYNIRSTHDFILSTLYVFGMACSSNADPVYPQLPQRPLLQLQPRLLIPMPENRQRDCPISRKVSPKRDATTDRE